MNDTAKIEDTAVEDAADYARQACLAGADAHSHPGGFAPGERAAMDAAFRLACQRVRRLRRWYVHALVYACVIGGLWLIYAWSPNSPRFAWPLPATLGWGLGLSIHGLAVWLSSSLQSRRWEALKIEQYMSEAITARAGGGRS